MKKTFLLIFAFCCAVAAGAVETFVSFSPSGGAFAVVKGGRNAVGFGRMRQRGRP